MTAPATAFAPKNSRKLDFWATPCYIAPRFHFMNKPAHIGKILLSGDEAVARGAWEAGLKVAAAYPGTPSTEILEALAQFADVDAQWSVNEKVAYEVAYGAAIGGVRALTACKHVGLNVAMDPLMTSAYTGINAGFVVVVADDPGLHSSQNEQDTRWVGLYGKLPILEPSDPAEALEFTRLAFELSEQFDTPVLLRLTTRVAHSKQDVAVGVRTAGPYKAFRVEAAKYVMVPRNAGPRHAVVEARLAKLRGYAEQTPLNRVELRDGKLGFVTSGVSYLYVREMFPEASVLKLGFSYPFCDEKIRAFAAQVQKLVVVEELDPFIETHLKALGLKLRAKQPSFRVGELRPEFIHCPRRGEAGQGLPRAQAGALPGLCASLGVHGPARPQARGRRRHRLLHARRRTAAGLGPHMPLHGLGHHDPRGLPPRPRAWRSHRGRGR